MNDFIDISVLSTIAGCSLLITLLTQVFKRYLPEKVDTKWLALIFSSIVGVLRIVYLHDFSFAGIVSGVINIFILLASAIGIYEIAVPAANKLKSSGGDDENEK